MCHQKSKQHCVMIITRRLRSHIGKHCRALQKKETHTAEEVKALLATHHFLGVGQQPTRSWFRQAEQGKLDVKSIEKLLAERDQARQSRDFEAADRIRDQLESQGILIEDSNGKTKWRHQ